MRNQRNRSIYYTVLNIALFVFFWSGLFSVEAAPAMIKKPHPLNMKIPYGQLTLSKAQQTALQASPVITEMLARIEEAQSIVQQNRATLFPTISVYAGHDWQDVSVRPDWSPNTRVEESFRHLNIGAEISWLLFDGFSRRASILAAKASVEKSEQLTNDSRRLLAESVAGAYYQAQLASEAMQIARQNALFNRNLEGDAEKRLRAGDIPEADYLNFSVKSLQAENQFLKAEQSFSVVCIILAKLMALPEPRLKEQMHPMAGEAITELAKLPELADELSYALQHRPDLLALSAEKEALLQYKTSTQGSYYPKVYANGSYNYDDYSDYGSIEQEEHDSTVGINLNWEVFSGGKRSAKIRETEAQLHQLQRQREEKILEIQSCLKQAMIRAESSKAVYERECYTLTLVKKIRDHVERSYRAGVTTLTRLNEAQSDLVSVSAAVAVSRITYLQQKEDLRVESGRILDGL